MLSCVTDSDMNGRRNGRQGRSGPGKGWHTDGGDDPAGVPMPARFHCSGSSLLRMVRTVLFECGADIFRRDSQQFESHAMR